MIEGTEDFKSSLGILTYLIPRGKRKFFIKLYKAQD